MTNEVVILPDTKATCACCDACCCRQEAMLFNDTEVPDKFIEIDTRGERSMARLEDGWCAALDRNTMSCTIYEMRPWICREFEMGGYECLSARVAGDSCRMKEAQEQATKRKRDATKKDRPNENTENDHPLDN